MALLSIDMIREIQGIADTYAERERARVSRASAAVEEQRAASSSARGRRTRARDEANA